MARLQRLDGERLIPQPGHGKEDDPPKRREKKWLRRGKQGRINVATLNAPGIHVKRRNAVGAEFDEGWGNGYDMGTKPSAKLAIVRDMITQRGISLIALTETRLPVCTYSYPAARRVSHRLDAQHAHPLRGADVGAF